MFPENLFNVSVNALVVAKLRSEIHTRKVAGTSAPKVRI